MLKKLALLSLLCITSAQAGYLDAWKVNTGSKIANTAFAFTGISIGSYAIYKVVSLAIDKLEHDGKISSTNASRLKNILKVKLPILPLYALYANFIDPTKMIPTSKIFQTFVGYISYGTRLIGPEHLIMTQIIKLFSSRK